MPRLIKKERRSDSMLFSIIIPTYNRVSLIPRAIESVLGQTYKNLELIIVDDGSTDNTKAVVERYRDDRIKYIYQENQERSAARNRGIHEAKGEWICFLDSDDEFPVERLMELNEAIQEKKQQKALYFTDIAFESYEGKQTIRYSDVNSNDSFTYLFTHVIGTPQVCVHREILEEFQFNVKLTNGEDLELWVRIQTTFPLIYLAEVSPIIAHEHNNRSVDLRRSNAANDRLKTLALIFSGNHPGIRLDKKIKRKLISDTQFNVAQHYMFNNQRLLAMQWILRSIISDRQNPQRKHRLFCLFSLLKGITPMEYKQYFD